MPTTFLRRKNAPFPTRVLEAGALLAYSPAFNAGPFDRFERIAVQYSRIRPSQMKCLDLTLVSPGANLACDDALLNACEATGAGEVLRFWEPAMPFVVVGYANRIEDEVEVEACDRRQIPILRRCSGGGTVLQGAGCLNFTLIFDAENHPELATVPGTNQFIMERQRMALATLGEQEIAVRGHTDLTLGHRKFSGNAQRRRRRALIFHGTFLLQFELALVAELLKFPSKQPDYRQSRNHLDFLTNLPQPAAAVKRALQEVWGAHEPFEHVPWTEIETLERAQYSQDSWNRKF
jgi:lipoate---protein ligase